MHRFFISNKQDNPQKQIIPTDDLFHQLTKVLRIREQEKFVCIYDDLELLCILSEDKIQVLESKTIVLDKSRTIRLVQGVPTSKKVSLIIQKATELDADEIILWQANRSTSKIDEFDKKRDRLEKIIIEACEQSRRNDVPTLKFINKVDELDVGDSTIIVLYENEYKIDLKETLKRVESNDITLVIGPEGGIEEKEIEEFESIGAIIASLGKNILRTETAAIAALAITGAQVK